MEIIITIYSDNDIIVPLQTGKKLQEELNAKLIIKKNKWHFSGDDNIVEVPVILEELIVMSNT